MSESARDYEHLPSRCLTCGYAYSAEAAVQPIHGGPEPGAIALCLNCGAPEIWTDAMTRRKMTFEEWNELERETKARVATGIVAICIRGRIR